MTKKAIHWFLSLFMASVATTANAQDGKLTHEDSLNVVLEKYYELNLTVFQANSQPKDIDNIFDLFTDDFEYIHPQYGGTYSRQDLYDGYVRNQKNGGYDGSVADIKILNKIVGLNAIAVSKSFVTTKDGEVTIGEAQMTMFEFRDGKISRIYEYW
ncbi:MAG: nuclear transport factor 2 family protein [Imperialibacter sp.]|uniref:nuclear transport factor 2 family protein n=1 Tax=Imperialibacter sp. TaxID=2038411 RepID=UPI0032F08025